MVNTKVSLLMFVSLVYCFIVWVITDLDTLIEDEEQNRVKGFVELS